MTKKGQTITIYMIDGEPTGRIKSYISAKNGIVYKIPRKMFEECKTGNGDIVKHLKQAGIYFLVGENQDGNPTIYVGQAGLRKNGEGLSQRLTEHIKTEKEKYWNDWNEILVFTTTDNSLHSTRISYLENKFRNLAIDCKRYVVLNGNEPSKGNIPEEDECVMQSYIEDVRMLIGILGYKVFEPLVNYDEVASNKNKYKFVYHGKFNAKALYTNEGFVILKGSEINPIVNKCATKSTINAREKYRNKIKDNKVTEDILLSSPSAAAAFVNGSRSNGNVFWKTENDESPKDVELQLKENNQ